VTTAGPHSTIASANTNIGRQSGAETLPDGSTVYFNKPFKWTADGRLRSFSGGVKLRSPIIE
jgi:hypothetical protein